MADQHAAASDSAETPRPKMGRLALVAVVGLLAGGSIGALYLGPIAAPLLPAPGEKSAASEGGEEGAAVPVHVIDNLVVNPAGSGGTRILLTTVAVELGSAEDAAALANLDVELRSALIVVLGTRSVDELTDVSQRDAIAREVFAAIEKVVGEDKVKRILIPQFVVQ